VLSAAISLALPEAARVASVECLPPDIMQAIL